MVGFLLCVFLPVSAPGGGEDEPRPISGSEAAAVVLEALDGTSARPWPAGGVGTQVFFFVSNDCPIANRYAPEIRRISDTFARPGVRFWVVHPLTDETPDSIREHAKKYASPGTVVRDREYALARLLGVTVTPEVAVVDSGLRVVYRGRIDDRFPALGQKRSGATVHDLRDALEAVVAGRAVARPRTKAVGCLLPKER